MGYGADAFAARSIKRATSSGLETYTAWLAGTSIVSLPARLAMLRSRSGLMLWSRVATSAQLFFWCQAAAVTGAPPAALASIVWEWAMKFASAWRDVGGEIGGEGGRVEVQEIVLGGTHVIVGGGRRREQAQCTLALVGDESGDVDEADDIWRIARFGDDHPAIAVADQKGWALLQIQHPFGRRDVVGK